MTQGRTLRAASIALMGRQMKGKVSNPSAAEEDQARLIALVRVAGLVLTLALVALAAPSDSQAAFPGDNGRIAFFSSSRDAIYTMNGRGGDIERIAKGGAYEPSFSADGRRIVFTKRVPHNYEIFTMRADGSHKKRLTHTARDEWSPSFSPDGRTVLFSVFVDYHFHWEVFSMRANGSNPVNLTMSPNARDESARFSPNGKRIVFMKDAQIASMRADGSDQRVLTPAPPDGSFRWNAAPDFSPDGRWIVFDRSTDSSEPDIHVMRADGTERRRLTHSGHSGSPVFSPNGQRIAFGSGGTIHTMRTDGSGRTRLTGRGKDYEAYASWGSRP
jgi:Tol biopolymer transport system component